MQEDLSKEEIRYLTNFIGELYHDALIDHKHLSICSCGNKGYSVIECCRNRYFNTDEDMMRVFRCLKEKRKWKSFWNFYKKAFMGDVQDETMFSDNYVAWLFDMPTRFCRLTADFLIKEEYDKIK